MEKGFDFLSSEKRRLVRAVVSIDPLSLRSREEERISLVEPPRNKLRQSFLSGGRNLPQFEWYRGLQQLVSRNLPLRRAVIF